MSAPSASLTASGIAGQWQVFSHSKLGSVDITYVRGVQTNIGSWTWSDPFGPKQFSLTFPGITMFEQLGQGDLAAIGREVDVDIEFIGALPANYPDRKFVVEGYMESFSWSTQGLSVECKGAMYQLDNYQAKPEYPSRPIPYEVAIRHQWEERHDLRLAYPQIIFPTWWTTVYTPKVPAPQPYLIPTGVKRGQKWFNMVTRSTGKWEPVLTSYMTSLLAGMYTSRGRFTIDLAPGRVPIMRHRDFAKVLDLGHLVIDAITPGLEINLTQDFSQSLNVLYGQGKALTGEGYSGRVVSNDGLDSDYLPLAALRQVDPSEDNNRWFDKSVMRREVLLELQQGLDEEQAQDVAINHLNRFSDPGYTGTMTLKSDPQFLTATGLVYLPRLCIKAGMTIQVPHLFGKTEGLLLHITEVSTDPSAQSSTLTVDSKYRDSLTVDEVNLRGRDSLAVVRSLIGGQYEPPVPDQLLPWNYAEGSGFIPSGAGQSCVPLFHNIDKEIRFPWTEITTARPPSSKAWRHCYVRIGPKSANANNNWAQTSHRVDNKNTGTLTGYPIRVSQAGQVSLVQVCAVDVNGNPLKVPFHVSFYYNRGVSAEAMPHLRNVDTNRGGYATGQAYPFFDSAWETYNMDGTRILTEQTLAKSSVKMIRGYGTGLVPAGYWPGDKPYGDPPTGQLVDEEGFSFDCLANTNDFDVAQPKQYSPFPGYIYMMLYCDAQATQAVYFIGRMFRTEPGSTG